MFKNICINIVSVIILSVSFTTHAVTFDYVAYETVVGEQAYDPLTGLTLIDGSGLSVTATAFDSVTGAAYWAYLDGPSGGPGGLGVCQNVNDPNAVKPQCVPNSDDNVTYEESLMLVFNQEVTIDQITFNNGDHQQNFSGDFDLSIDGGAATTYSLTNIFNTPLTGTEFVFTNPNSMGGSGVSNEYQFYIGAMEVTPVPVPAAVWLFASGLLGLVGVARRRAS